MPHFYGPNVIDIEASGFGYDSYPIEIGVALSDGQRICTLVLPEEKWTHWDNSAEQVHKISRETLKAYGKPVREVAERLNQQLDGIILYSDGWVVDKPWLTTLFRAAGIPMRFYVSPLEAILSEAQMSVWHKTKDRIMMEQQLTRHRASNDAYLIQETFKQTLQLTRSFPGRSAGPLDDLDPLYE